MGNYTTVSIPMSMAEEIDKLIQEHPEKGYRSRADFIIDLLRKRLTGIDRKRSKKPNKNPSGTLDRFTS